MGKCKVQATWLKRKDSRGMTVSQYAVMQDPHTIFCTACSSTINCSKGFQAIECHSKTPKHIRNVKDKFDPNQLHLEARQGSKNLQEEGRSNPADDNNNQNQGWMMSCTKDDAIKAELLWALNVVATNASCSSCNNVTPLFQVMFPNMPPNFSMGRTKVTYYITEALGPYFRKHLLHDLVNTFYSIEFHESNSNAGMKECQISLRFWSKQENAAVSRYLQSSFIGHAQAERLLEVILEALDKADLPLSKMLMAGCDGPYVNHKLLRLLNAKVKSAPGRDNSKGLLQIGTCNLHIVHNAYEKAVGEFGKRCEDFFLNVYAYLDAYPSRKEDFSVSQEKTKTPQHQMIKFVPSRWLTLGPVAERFKEQHPALKHYFTEEKRKRGSEQTKTGEKLRKIVADLNDPILKAEIMFLAETTKPFERFSRIFQKAEPVVHILYEECRNLVTLLISKICTSDTVKKFDSINDPFAAESLKPVDSLRFGDEIEKLLKSQCESKSLSEKDVLLFRQSAQKHYIAAVKHILEKSILQWKEAKHLRFLQPNYIPKEGSTRSAMIVNRALPLEIAEADLHDEWTLLRIDNLPKYSSGERIDHYWAKIFEIENGSGEAKYPLVTKLVKATLSLVHGSADVERRFSDSGNQLTEDRASMSERTFNARMTVKDALKRFNNQPQLVMITRELISMGSSACSAYKAHLEREEETRKRKAEEKKREEEEAEIQRKMLAEQEKKKEDLKKLEERLKEAKKEEKDFKDARESLIDEAIKKLDAAVKKKDLTGVKVAEGLLRGAQSLKTGSNNPEVEKLDKEVSKRKSSLISGLIAKKCRSDNGNQSHKK